jgi:hypothetical protein
MAESAVMASCAACKNVEPIPYQTDMVTDGFCWSSDTI